MTSITVTYVIANHSIHVLASFNYILYECSLKMYINMLKLSHLPSPLELYPSYSAARRQFSAARAAWGPPDMRFFKNATKFSGGNHPKGGYRWHMMA